MFIKASLIVFISSILLFSWALAYNPNTTDSAVLTKVYSVLDWFDEQKKENFSTQLNAILNRYDEWTRNHYIILSIVRYLSSEDLSIKTEDKVLDTVNDSVQNDFHWIYYGEGDDVVELRWITKWFYRWQFKWVTDSNYMVELVDDSWNVIDYLVNEIWDTDVSLPMVIESDKKHYVSIEANGWSWNIDIAPVEGCNSDQPPLYLKWNSELLTKWVYFNQWMQLLELSHDWDSNFIVQLIDSEGSVIEYLVNEIWEYTWKKSVWLDEWCHYFYVTGNGEWKIEFE
jgi:hypothetical protein